MEEQVARYVARGQKEPLPPPIDETGFAGRVRKSLFATPLDSVLTLVFGAVSVWVLWSLFNWAVLTAVFEGSDRQACLAVDGGTVGACWAFVEARFAQFMYGLYPVNQRWRVDLVFVALVLLLIPLAIPRVPFKRLNAVLAAFVFPVFAFVLLTGGRMGMGGGTAALLFLVAAGVTLALASGRSARATSHPAMKAGLWLVLAAFLVWGLNLFFASGSTRFLGLRFTTISLASFALSGLAMVAAFLAVLQTSERKVSALAILVPGAGTLLLIGSLTASFGLPNVPTNFWGGLLVTLVVAIVGIACSLPLGILLALGRQSRMPAVRLLSIVFIEFWRGVPLITVLFMANFMLPLFLPSGVTLNQLLRVLVGVSLFAAAYIAEVVRGGLQAIPRGQYEGADAMALTYWQKMRMIILPQALTLVIPGIVNTFIGLFKDTSLVYIIGLADLLGTVRRGFSDPNWITPSTPGTGLVFAGFVFWLFCFGMSQYSIFMERNLSKGHKH